jgi:predicted nucleotidyltransferase/DNA-binding XRE family transcriptional regulator
MEVSAAEVIRDARLAARLSQTDLARRAGVAQSVISAYESGRREPGMSMLRKLVEASGHDLVVEAVASAGQQLGLPDTRLGRRLRRRRQAVIACAARRGASNVRVFGSVARGEDTDGSDVDLLVDLAPEVGLVGLSALSRELTELLGVPVDVVPAAGLKTSTRDEALAEAVPL